MDCLCVGLIVPLLALMNMAFVGMFKRRHASIGWWAASSSAWLAGAAAGVYGGFFEYELSPTLRVVGALVPVGCWHLEGPPGQEGWVDFITQAPVLDAWSNVIILGLLAAAPVGLLFWLTSRREPRIQYLQAQAVE